MTFKKFRVVEKVSVEYLDKGDGTFAVDINQYESL